ncbi:MAG: transcription termination factor Rho [Lachnospiraceae bacterium]|nr:transcription termination factor Rho [Lachnospiraceae bacterium]
MADYSKKSLAELRDIGKAMGVKSVTTFKKSELVEKILEKEKENSKAEAKEPKKTVKKVEKRTEASKESRSDVRPSPRKPVTQRMEHKPEKRQEAPRRNNGGYTNSGYNNTNSTGAGNGGHNNGGYSNNSNNSNNNGGYTSQKRSDNKGPQRSYNKDQSRYDSQKSDAVDMRLDSGETKEGILEVLNEGYGFIRCDNFLPGENDVYVAPAMIRKFGLRTGDIVEGNTRVKNMNERFGALLYITKVNGFPPEALLRREKFENLTPIFPDERIRLETAEGPVAMRMLDIISPIGKGQRGMIVSQPKTGKTTLLKQVAKAVKYNYPKMNIIVLLIDERPEEVTDIKESIMGNNVEVIYSTFDELPENHKRVAEMVIERGKRLVEHGEDVIILLDSITRLARAYNLTVTPSGRTLSGGLDPAALHMPKRFFGAARNMREGGSLTILATALVDTGSKMDDVVFEEFKGTGNMELVLDRALSEKRLFPAINLPKSSTRREDLLLRPDELEAAFLMRKAFSGVKGDEAVERIIKMFKQTKDNHEFINMIHKVKIV